MNLVSSDTGNTEHQALCALTAGIGDEFLFAMLEQSRDCIKLLSPEGDLAFMSGNGQAVMEIADFDALRGKKWWTLWPKESQETVQEAVNTARLGRAAHFTAQCPTGKGNLRWWDVGVSPVLDSNGEVKSLISISRDVTSQHEREIKLQTVALEMRHRLKNAFAVSGALAKILAAKDANNKAFAANLAQCFSDLAVAQSLLLDTNRNSLRQLLQAIVKPYGAEMVKFDFDDDADTECDESQSRAIALIIGELLTNSIKHGALRDGAIPVIECRRLADAVVLNWSEGITSAVESTAFQREGGAGLVLMKRMAAAVGGSFDQTISNDKVSASFRLPIIGP